MTLITNIAYYFYAMAQRGGHGTMPPLNTLLIRELTQLVRYRVKMIKCPLLEWKFSVV